jgi:hypothetical protein
MQLAPGRYATKARLASLALALALSATGCRSVLGIEDTALIPEACLLDDQDLGSGVGWWSSCNFDAACLSAGMPVIADRPAASSDGPSEPTFYLANRSMHFGSRNQDGELDANAWQHLGFDLDGVCTLSASCAGAGNTAGSCQTPSSAPPTDGAFCRDNQTGKLAFLFETRPDLADQFIADDAELNCGLCNGDYNFILRIKNYNGQPDDPSVRVDFYPSTGLQAPRGIDCTQDTWDPSQCWTGSDVWKIQSESLSPETFEDEALPSSFFYDPTAFVRNGTLVARLPPNTIMWYPSGDTGLPVLPLTVQEGSLTGTLSRSSDGWALLDGVIAGRSKGTDMLRNLQRVGLCDGTAGAGSARAFIETSLDVLSTGATDPTVPCDALSMALAVTAAETQVGGGEPFALPDLCAATPTP